MRKTIRRASKYAPRKREELRQCTDESAESLRLAKEAVSYLNAFIAYLEPIIEQEIARKVALARGNISASDPAAKDDI